MGKECGAWVSRRLWGGSNTNPLKTTAWEAKSVININYMKRRFQRLALSSIPPNVTMLQCWLMLKISNIKQHKEQLLH